MSWLAAALRGNPELALFVVLAIGYAIGRVRVGAFTVGPVLGSLIAGLAIGQLNIAVPEGIKDVFFLLFVFAMGLQSGAEFFRSLRSSGVKQLAVILTLCATTLALTWGIAFAWDLDAGSAAGLLGGALTNSTVLGTASDAAAGLGLDAAAQEQLGQNLAGTYALTYMVGLALFLWFLPHVGPRLMRVNLKEVSRELELSLGLSSKSPINSGYRPLATRAYRVPASFEGMTVAELESQWPPHHRAMVLGLRRGEALLDAVPGMRLQGGDAVAVGARSTALIGEANPLAHQELHDRELLDLPAVSADLLLTNRSLGGQTLRTLAEQLGARGIFLVALKRGGRELPFTASTVIERGDLLSVSGTRAEVARVAAEVGYAEYASASTDLLPVAATIALGGLAGLVSVQVGGLALSLSPSVGVLLAGLLLGHLRSRNPRLGRVPEASARVFESLGLSAFLASIGLQAGPGAIAAARESGVALAAAAAAIVIVPNVVTILIGHYLIRMHPAILLGVCAGANGSGPTIAALEEVAESRVPTLGYGIAFALGNVIVAISGALLVVARAG